MHTRNITGGSKAFQALQEADRGYRPCALEEGRGHRRQAPPGCFHLLFLLAPSGGHLGLISIPRRRLSILCFTKLLPSFLLTFCSKPPPSGFVLNKLCRVLLHVDVVVKRQLCVWLPECCLLVVVVFISLKTRTIAVAKE